MEYQILQDEVGEQTYVLVFGTGDDVVDGLLQFARKQNLSGSRFTAIGALQSLTIGYFVWDKKEYEHIEINEQVEVLSLIGDITVEQGEPKLHAHIVVGKRDGTAHGGHLIAAKVRPTLEVMLEETPTPLHRKFDPESGIALISLES